MAATDAARPLRWVQFAGDLLLLTLAFGLAYWIKFLVLSDTTEGNYTLLAGVFVGAWLISAFILGGYAAPRLTDLPRSALQLARMLGLHLLLVAAFVALSKGYLYSREQLLYSYLIAGLLLVVWRVGFILTIRSLRRRGWGVRRVGLWGSGPAANELIEFFHHHPEAGLQLVAQFADDVATNDVTHYPATLEAIGRVTDEQQLAELYVSLPGPSDEQLNALIELSDNRLLRIRLLPDFGILGLQNLSIELYGDLPVVAVQSYPLDDWGNRALKRGFDIVFSLLFFLLIASWLFPIIALLVRLSSPGPIFFRQRRSGLGSSEFWCYKFRSMRASDDADTRQASRHDDRITPFGRFMRRTSLDELPQFWNVLLGQMSVVGPRPHMLVQTEHFSQLIDKYMLRHAVKPGVTGLAQARGFRGETPTVWHMQSRVKFDRFYVNHWSLWLDIRIIAATVAQMIRGNQNAF